MRGENSSKLLFENYEISEIEAIENITSEIVWFEYTDIDAAREYYSAAVR